MVGLGTGSERWGWCVGAGSSGLVAQFPAPLKDNGRAPTAEPHDVTAPRPQKTMGAPPRLSRTMSQPRTPKKSGARPS
ncbi:hypothetical protein GCM10010306_044900 [Streptomyces umbrinus]|nr:hypothetical protein GCM10010306_044900 [Streptomyces umbrinus]